MRFSLFTVLLLALITSAGCGSSDRRATVKGKVTVAGKGPLSGGMIQFISVADPAKSGSGVILADGSYSVGDAPVGECKILIDNSHLNPSSKGGMPMGPTGGMGMGPGPGSMVKGAGGGGGPPVNKEKGRMNAPPKGADISSEMDADRAGLQNQKWIKLDGTAAKAATTPLTYTVEPQGGTKDFDVK
jgi:hypothetical protein